jgi:benzylsuccinate CoA-transferase BbsF subunit
MSENSGEAGIFEGLRVIDFTWAAAGPILTKQFSDNGADVIKIESRTHPDSVRLGGPFFEAKPGINRSGFFADFNSSKKSVAIDMATEAGRDLVRRMIAGADIVADNFRPGVLQRWGLGHDVLHAMNPRAVLVSSSLYGESGPWATLAGFGAQGAASAGIHGLTGWPDLPPALPKGAYTDSVSPRYAMAAVMAALIHRERTGVGQRIELSQVEATVSILATELLGYQLTGVEPKRAGNRREGHRLHAVLPCAGDDRWIAIDARDDRDWEALCDVLHEVSGDDPRQIFDAFGALAKPDEVERTVANITMNLDPFELEARLHRAGVPAGVALKGSDLLADPKLRARGHFWALPHAEMGTLDYNGPAYRFHKTPSRLVTAAPLIGEHTDEVVRELLGLDDAEIAALREQGVLQ